MMKVWRRRRGRKWLPRSSSLARVDGVRLTPTRGARAPTGGGRFAVDAPSGSDASSALP